MKKFLLVLTGFVLAVAVFSVAGFAYAQTQTPPDANYPCPYCDTTEGHNGRGRGMRGGFDIWATANGEYGPLHETMASAFADMLALSVGELEARLEAGETMFDIAETQGLTPEEFSDMMFAARSVALDQAVADSQITQEQADWMQSRWDEMKANGFGPGSNLGTGPCHGGNFGGSRDVRGGGRGSGNQ